MNRFYEINASVSEIIDGKAVIMHLKSGNYLNTSDHRGVVWHGLETRLGAEALTQASSAMAHRLKALTPIVSRAASTL